MMHCGIKGCVAIRLILHNMLSPGWQKKRGLLFTVSSPATVNMGSFARLAKATYLLCLVLKRTNVAGADETSLSESAKQLDQDIRALASLPDVEGQSHSVGGSPQVAFCHRYDLCRAFSGLQFEFAPFFFKNKSKADAGFSALFILHDLSSSRTDQTFVRFARELLSVVKETFSSSPRFVAGNPSPLLIHWMYQAASIHSRLFRVTDNEDSELLENFKLQLRTLNRRWMVAGIHFPASYLVMP